MTIAHQRWAKKPHMGGFFARIYKVVVSVVSMSSRSAFSVQLNPQTHIFLESVSPGEHLSTYIWPIPRFGSRQTKMPKMVLWPDKSMDLQS